MMELDITFGSFDWEGELLKYAPTGSISAMEMLTVLDRIEEQTAEEAFLLLEEQKIALMPLDLPVSSVLGQAAERLQLEQRLAQQADMTVGLDETDPLRLYLEELAQIPVAGDESVLAMELLEGNSDAMQRLTDLSLSRVIEMAKALTGHGVLLMDLIQEGSLGLWQGLLCYTGGDFGAHRDWWIRQYLHKAVVQQAYTGGVGQKIRQGLSDYRDMDQRLLAELGRNPTMEEIAEAMHVSVAEAQMYADQLQATRSDARVKQTEQLQEDPQEENQAVEDTAYFQMRQRIQEWLAAVSPRDARLLTLRFALEGGLPLTPEQAGAELGMTPAEVVAAEAAALAILRKQ